MTVKASAQGGRGGGGWERGGGGGERRGGGGRGGKGGWGEGGRNGRGGDGREGGRGEFRRKGRRLQRPENGDYLEIRGTFLKGNQYQKCKVLFHPKKNKTQQRGRGNSLF